MEAMKPKQREIEPQYNELIGLWLVALAGAQIDRLIVWLRGVADLDQPKPLLVLHGAPGSGKTLLVEGLARIWAEGPIPHRRIDEAFQSYDLLPMAVVDEPGNENLIKQAAILALSVKVPAERKYQERVEVERVRVIVMQNTPFTFDALGRAEIQTIACQSEASAYLSSLSRDEITSWIDEDKIAAHVLSLG